MRTLCNFPAAIKLPEKVTAPTTIAIAAVVNTNLPPKSPIGPINVRRPTTAEAAPPSPFKRATVWGIEIISTLIVK